MNVGGGEAADQLVRMILSGTELLFKMSGSAFKDALAIAIALSKENKKVSGKINLGKMLRQTRDIRTFSMSPEQYERFRKQAKKQKILFSAVKDRDKKGAVVDVILPATEVERANQIFERIHYDPKKGPENPPPEAEKPKHWWQKVFRGRGKSKEKESEAKAETAVKQDSPAKSGENQNPTTPDGDENRTGDGIENRRGDSDSDAGAGSQRRAGTDSDSGGAFRYGSADQSGDIAGNGGADCPGNVGEDYPGGGADYFTRRGNVAAILGESRTDRDSNPHPGDYFGTRGETGERFREAAPGAGRTAARAARERRRIAGEIVSKRKRSVESRLARYKRQIEARSKQDEY